QFANGVRLNLKRTTFEPGRVRLTVRVDGGKLSVPPDQPGLEMRIFAWLFGGMRDLTFDELRPTLSDLTGEFNLVVSRDEFRLVQTDDTANLPLLLQLCAAFFTRPAFQEATQSLGIVQKILTPSLTTASGVAEAALSERMTGRHPPTMDQVRQRTVDELKAWLLPQLAAAPVEISIVGDFEAGAAIDAVARTLGALPARHPGDPYAELRNTELPPPAFSEAIVFDGNTSVAAAALAWPLPGNATHAPQFQAHLLGTILKQRLWQKLRVETGDAYVIEAAVAADAGLRPPVAYLQCRVEAAPERVEQIAATLRDVAELLARDGATAEELERARQPFVRDTETGLRDNDWWIDLLAVAQSTPTHSYAWARALDRYKSVSLEEINALARRVIVRDRLCQLIVRPK
ncbi:MAG: insulinase family protein, partial [Opitutaceae bacterium]